MFGITGTAVGGALLLLLAWHVLRRLLDIPRVPLRAGTYVFLVVACAALLAGGLGALGLAAALDDWESVPDRVPLAEVHCQKTGTGARLTFVALKPDGTRGAEEAETVDALPCDLAIARLQFIPALARLGQRQRVSRVGPRPRATATPPWRALPRPFGLVVAEAADHQLTVPPEDDHAYRVVSDGSGFRVERQ